MPEMRRNRVRGMDERIGFSDCIVVAREPGAAPQERTQRRFPICPALTLLNDAARRTIRTPEWEVKFIGKRAPDKKRDTKQERIVIERADTVCRHTRNPVRRINRIRLVRQGIKDVLESSIPPALIHDLFLIPELKT
jgi:hypothetical protein